MSEHAAKDQGSKGLFDAAGDIAKILESHSKDNQERILRLVVEGLKLADPLAKAHLGTEPGPEAPAGEKTASTSRKDIKTFVAEKQPKSDVQFATVTAYYFRFEATGTGRKDAISADDLQEAARLAGWKRFGKPYVPLQNAANQGYLDRAERGTFQINAVGENLVAMTLPGGKAEAGSGSAGRNGRKVRSKKGAKRPTKGSRQRDSK